MIKVLLDTCVWGGVYNALISLGYDVVWAGLWDTDPGDAKILDLAYQQQRVLITLDKDFGELAILHNLPHCGIVRLVNLSTTQQVNACIQILTTHRSELEAACIMTVEHGRIRIRLND
jgi:predicted nuclease of predicted toxin-antitoxin system